MQRAAPESTPLLELGEFGFAALQIWLGGWSEPAARHEQAMNRLQALIRVARERAPLYRRLYRNLRDDRALSLAELPVVNKSDLMADVAAGFTDVSITPAALHAFVADPTNVGTLFHGRYAVWTSSGTSGTPGLFLHDTHALAVYEALETLRFRGLSSLAQYGARVLAGERFALVMVTGGHFASVSSAEHLRRAFPWLAANVAPFSLFTPLAQLVAQLNQYRPTLLATYPTAAQMLAQEQDAGRLQLQLAEMWTGGEVLAPHVRTRLEQVFGCRVRNSYGASEFPSIGWECGLGSLHVNSDWVLLEGVDEAYRPVPAGTPSHTTLLTNLANHVQPLIRYELGDSITLLPPCACGSTFPAIRVEGRHDDALRFADETGRLVTLLPLVLSTVLEEQAGVHDFQVTQTDAHNLRVSLGSAEPAADERVRSALAAHLAQQGVRDIRLEVDALPPLRSARSGKLRRVICEVKDRPPAGSTGPTSVAGAATSVAPPR